MESFEEMALPRPEASARDAEQQECAQEAHGDTLCREPEWDGSEAPEDTEPEAPDQRLPEKKKKGLGPVLRMLLPAAVLCGVCAAVLCATGNYWERQYRLLEQSFSERYAVMEEAADNRVNALKEQMEEALAKQNAGSSAGIADTEEGSQAMTPAQVYMQNAQAVVAISSQGVTTNIYGQTSSTASTGSGFIVSEDGYVVTNYHVVEGGTTLTVITYDSTEYAAELVGYDSTNDVAVLKMEGEGFPCAPIGSSDLLAVGDRVAAIGNPLGELTSTMTVGYVSAKDRAVTTEGSSINMLQTDAAINSGNSGGPLFNMNGEVVGITTAKYSGYSTSGTTIEGIGFAIPIDDVIDIIADLCAYGYVRSTYLGVYVRDIDSSVAQIYGLPAGVYVESVESGHCAEAAGIRAGDILINLGGYDISNMSELSRALRKFSAGDQTTVTVFRDGQKVDMRITLEAKPVQSSEPTATEPNEMPAEGSYEEWFDYFFGNN